MRAEQGAEKEPSKLQPNATRKTQRHLAGNA